MLPPPQLIFRCGEARKAGESLVEGRRSFLIGSRGVAMAINLVSLVQQFLTPQMVSSLARAVGVNEAVAQKLVAAALPAVLAALGTAAAAPGGAQKVSDAISNSDPDVLTKVSQAASGGNARFLNEGGALLSG